jgi:hypothetical protein
VIDGGATSMFRELAVSNLNQNYRLLVWKVSVGVLLTTIAVSGYYLPIPLTDYPPEDTQSFVSTFTLMNVGIRPWMLALVLWQGAAMLWYPADKGFPVVSAFSARLQITALLLAGFTSFNAASMLNYWRLDDPVSFISILLPTVSLVTFCILLIFLGRMMDRLWEGFGIWALYAGISVSGAGLVVFEIAETLSIGSITISQFGIVLVLTAASIPISILTVWLHQKRLTSDSRPLLFVVTILVFLKSILWEKLQVLMLSEPATAIYFTDHSVFLNGMTTAILSILIGLIWLRFWPNHSFRAIVLPYIGLVLLFGIYTILLESPTPPLLGPAEFLLFAMLGLELHRVMNDVGQRKAMKAAFAARSR